MRRARYKPIPLMSVSAAACALNCATAQDHAGISFHFGVCFFLFLFCLCQASHEQSNSELHRLVSENESLRDRLKTVVQSPLSDSEKQQLIRNTQRLHSSAPASIALPNVSVCVCKWSGKLVANKFLTSIFPSIAL